MKALHEGISVPNVEESIRWYRDTFGFQLLADEVVEPLKARIAFMLLGDFELEIFQYLGDDGKALPPGCRVPNEDLKTCGVKHVAWQIEDMDKEYKRLSALNVDVAMPPFQMKQDKVCFIRDNSGIILELIQKNACVP